MPGQMTFAVKDSRYSGETINMPKPQLNDLKRKIQAMSVPELVRLLSDKVAMKDLYFQDPEVVSIKSQIDRLTKDVQQQTQENLTER